MSIIQSGGGMNPAGLMMQGGGIGFNDDAFGGFGLGFGVNPNFGGVPRLDRFVCRIRSLDFLYVRSSGRYTLCIMLW